MKLHVRRVKYDGAAAIALYFSIIDNESLEREKILVQEKQDSNVRKKL